MGFKRLERALTSGFRWYGRLVGTRPIPFFVVPLLVTVLLAPGLYFVAYNDDVVMLFTPYDAPSRHEQEVFKEFSYVQPLAPVSAAIYHDDRNGQTNRSVDANGKKERFLLQTAKNTPRANPWFFLYIHYRNDSNIMNVETFHYIYQMVHYLYNNYTCQVATNKDMAGPQIRTLRYNPDFCNPDDPNGYDCPRLDDQINFISDLLNRSNTDNGKIRLTYPVMYVLSRPVNWGHFILGAVTNASTTKLQSATLMGLKLNFQFDLTDEDTYLAKHCIAHMTEFIRSINDGAGGDYFRDMYARGLRFLACNPWTLNSEVMEIKTRTEPIVAVTAILVTLYTLISSYYSKAPIFGAMEALLGVLTIGLSLAATFALLFVCNQPFNFVTIMTPLLTLCVGIDNDFLLMSAWRRPHLEGLPAAQRLAYAFAEVGPSLTITSVNDVLCFAVGCLSESPAISMFCLFTCVSLTFRYLYQLTFFSGALAYICQNGPKINQFLGKAFDKIRHVKVLPFGSKKAVPWTNRQGSSSTEETPREASNPSLNTTHQTRADDHVMHRFFRGPYSSFISRPWVRFVIILLFTTYLGLSIYSATRMIVNVSMQKLFLDTSILQEDFGLAQKYAFQRMVGVVIVQRPPDFRNKTNVKRFMEFVSNLERMDKFSPDPKDTTVLWLRDYMEFSSYVGNSASDFYDYMAMFLTQEEYAKHLNDIRFNFSKNGRLQVESFQFSTYFQNVNNWDDSSQILLHWRDVCRNYSEYEAIVQDFNFRNSYLDQRLTLSGSTLQTMGIASLSIAFVTSLLMPDMTSIFFICFSSLSVDLGVIGALNAWGSDLDPITMACLLMTIGFSVYYTARICYCYQKMHEDASLGQKLAFTLGSVGWPILQGGLATLIGIIPLVFIQSYMIRTFFRTIVLVVAVGLLHGLLFMPVLMSLYDRENTALKILAKKRRDKRQVQAMRSIWRHNLNWSV